MYANAFEFWHESLLRREFYPLNFSPVGLRVPGGLMLDFAPNFWLFFSPWDLWTLSADRRKILLCEWKRVYFYNPVTKFRGASTEKIWGPKTCKIWRDLGRLQISTANISGRHEDIQNRTRIWSTAILPTFTFIQPKMSGELWFTNCVGVEAKLYQPKSTFSEDHFLAPEGGGFCASIFLNTVENDPWLTSAPTFGDGVSLTMHFLHYAKAFEFRSCDFATKRFNTQNFSPNRTQSAGWTHVGHCPKFLVIVGFSYTYISQGSVATELKFGGIFNNHFVANCPCFVPAKEFWKSVDIWTIGQ